MTLKQELCNHAAGDNGLGYCAACGFDFHPPALAQDKIAAKLAKPDMLLIPGESLKRAARAMEFGARKYSRHGWRKVPDGVGTYLNACLRHLYSYADGEHSDPESGLSHLDHALASLLFAVAHDSGLHDKVQVLAADTDNSRGEE